MRFSSLNIPFASVVIETASNNQPPHQLRDVMRTFAIRDLSSGVLFKSSRRSENAVKTVGKMNERTPNTKVDFI